MEVLEDLLIYTLLLRLRNLKYVKIGVRYPVMRRFRRGVRVPEIQECRFEVGVGVDLLSTSLLRWVCPGL